MTTRSYHIMILVLTLSTWTASSNSATIVMGKDEHLSKRGFNTLESIKPPTMRGGKISVKKQDSVPHAFVVNGTPASPGQFPYQARLEINNDLHCGAVIIDQTHVLTAAHCVSLCRDGGASKSWAPSSFEVVVGDLWLDDRDGGKRIQLSNITIHPDHNGCMDWPHPDIAILKLTEEIDFSKVDGGYGSVDKARLPEQDFTYKEGEKVTLTGWGSTSRANKFVQSEIMLKAEMEIVPDGVCNKFYPSPEGLPTEGIICAGFSVRRENSCYGDSGGALVRWVETRVPELVGIVSMGYECGEEGIPSAYTKVSSFIDWINEVTAND